jgi:hypothetical protein
MVEKKCRPIETIEKRPGEDIGPEEAKKLNSNKEKK